MSEGATFGNPVVVRVWASPPYGTDTACSDTTHYFDGPTGKCHCGKSEWDPPADQRPKLRLVE